MPTNPPLDQGQGTGNGVVRHPLSQGTGYGVVLGLGFAFAFGMIVSLSGLASFICILLMS